MATLDDAITKAMSYIAVMSGIKQAPDRPPEQAGAFPFAVGFPGDGDWIEAPAGNKQGLHNVIIELHVARKELPFDYALAIPYIDSIPNTLFSNLSDKWDGVISTFSGISYRWGEMSWGGGQTLGIQFTIRGVKIQSAVT
jgi:hypothetical protein